MINSYQANPIDIQNRYFCYYQMGNQKQEEGNEFPGTKC